MEQEQKHYYAFISHSSEDEKIAKWLRRKLEGYHIPTTIQKEYHAPKKLKPIFLYQTDLAGNKLRGALNGELSDSQFLIVICSPSAAKSYFVNEEVKHFIDSGRTDKIIPFIVEGTPFASLKGDVENECFPPALVALKGTEDELRGIDLREEKNQRGFKMAAVIDVIASMLGVRFSVLWDKYVWRKIRQYSLITILLLIIFSLGYLIWEYYRPIYRYYADYVDKWGIPQGIIELDETTLKHRNRSYKFEYHRIPFGETNALSWRSTPTKVEYINSAGQPQDYKDGVMYDRYAIMHIKYNSSGSINHIDLCNKSGKTILRWKVSSYDGQKAALVDFLGISDTDASGYLGAFTTISNPHDDFKSVHKSSIKRYFFQRDKDGYIVSKSYHSSNADNLESSKTSDANGVYKQVFINDSLGRVIKTTFYDICGNISTRGSGVAIRKYTYDSWGNYCQIDFLNSQETPVLNDQQCARITSKSDMWGNIVKNNYWGLDGKLCFNQNGFAEETILYNEKGYPISVSYYDDNRLLCRQKSGYARLLIKCDSRGNQIENRYEDMSQKPCVNSRGIAKVSAEYDRWGNIVYKAYFGPNGQLIQNDEGVAGQNSKYDKYGNCIQTDFFDVNWNACSNNMGFATMKIEYNEIGYPIHYTLFDVYGKRTICDRGFSSFTYQYERGNPVEITYFDIKDLPCTNMMGFHKVGYKFDAAGNLTEFAYYDTIGNLCLSNEHFAYCRRFPDSLGNIQKWTYYDIDSKRTKDNQGVCTYLWTYDDFGRATSVRFLDEENNPIMNREGIAGWNASYDKRGNQIEYYNIDVDGNICHDSSGIASWKNEFDKRGNQVSYATYDIFNRPKSCSNGVASWISSFDNRGLLLSTSYYDEKGNPSINADIGYSRYEAKYDTSLNLIEVCTYDNNGNLCVDPKMGYAKWIAHYNENGDKVEMLSFSEKDSLCVCKYGYARWTASYDKNGYTTEYYAYDAQGNVIVNNKIEDRRITENLIKKYDSHRFQYNIMDIIVGFLFIVLLLAISWYWLKKITSLPGILQFLCPAGIIVSASFAYILLREFLLHYSLIPYDIYNFSWILHLVSSILLSIVVISLLVVLVLAIVSIIKSPKKARKNKLKESQWLLIGLLFSIAGLVGLIYFFIDEGWIIYSNPL